MAADRHILFLNKFRMSEIETTSSHEVKHIPDKYEYKVFRFDDKNTEDEQGRFIELLQLTDKETGVRAIAFITNTKFPSEAVFSWVAAMVSRNDTNFDILVSEIINKMNENPNIAFDKLEKAHINYGHASLGDMMNISIALDGITEMEAFRDMGITLV